MSVGAIGAGYEAKPLPPASGNEQEKPADVSRLNRLNAEIKQAEAEMKETLKEVQKAAKESVNGASDKVQLLQSKLLMQQQAIMTKQMQVKEIDTLTKPATEQGSSTADTRPKFDRYVAETEDAKAPDNVYHMEEKDGNRKIVFNRPEA